MAMSKSDFSKIMELIELRERYKRRSGEVDEGLEKRRQANSELEEEVKRGQAQIRKMREYMNDGQKKLDGLADKYAPLLRIKEEKIAKLKAQLEQLEKELGRRL